MADISKDELRKEINTILKDADLRVMSAKKVRQQLESELGCNLNSRKKEIDDLVMNYVNSKEDENDQSEEEEEEEDEEEEEKNDKKKPAKRPAPAAKKPAARAKKSKADSSEDGEESKETEESDDDEEYEAKKPVPKKKAPAKKRGKGSESDSDSDSGKNEKPKKAAGGRGKGGGYTRAYKLSPSLASLMGKDSMARHEVVKKVWAIIKEKNLYDPSNKQFAICDDDLYKVMGVKRFRTFGMMKYLKTHFHD